MSQLTIRHFTDPACPWDYSSEPARLRLNWRYGDAVSWEICLVVLTRSADEYAVRGATPESLAATRGVLARRYGMPINSERRTPLIATLPACRALAAVRRHAPNRLQTLLRRLRVIGLSEGEATDQPNVIMRAVVESGLDPSQVSTWMADPMVDADVVADMVAARDPSPAALALPERLEQGPEGAWRYTCPSYVLTNRDGLTVEAPGFQPVRTYEVAIANLAPEITARPAPTDVGEVLDWAPYPLTTAEVAEICEIERELAWDRLAAVADIQPTAGGAFWSARAVARTSAKPAGSPRLARS